MTLDDSSINPCPLALSHDHDITTQATSGTRPALTFNDQRYSFISASEDSFSFSSFISASSSRTSLSSDSSDELPTRPSSRAGWEYEGAWSIGNTVDTSGLLSFVDANDLHCDPAETDLTKSPLLIAQFVAQQLRADVLDDFLPWSGSSPDPQTPTPKSPAWIPMPASPRPHYADLIAALGLNSPSCSPRPFTSTNSISISRHGVPATPPVPTIMVTAPSSDPPSPVFRYNSVGYELAANSLMIQWCARRNTSSGNALAVNSDADDGTNSDDDDDDISLSDVKRNLETRSRYGLRGKVLALLKRRV